MAQSLRNIGQSIEKIRESISSTAERNQYNALVLRNNNQNIQRNLATSIYMDQVG